MANPNRSLAELSAPPPDEDVVRRWLAERGLVAVDRNLMEQVVKDGVTRIVYHPLSDRYTLSSQEGK